MADDEIQVGDVVGDTRHETSADSEDESGSEAPADLMVTTRARRSNAGNRMSTLLAKSAEEEDEWGEEWEEAPNEEEFRGDDVNEQDDYNMDSSSSEEDADAGDDDDAGERELRKAERQEKSKKRKAVTNPFAARVAAVTRKKVKLDLPRAQSPVDAPLRPKKKSERASWVPTEEDGPVRASARTQTVANKEATLSKLLEKDRRRDDTLAMMKAAEARKKKDEPKPLTQAERLAEAARNERVNKKTLHRWEEAEEARAAERQAKIDALKNRQIQGPFIRYYSGPAIWVDDRIKFTGKDAPSIEQLEEKLNKETAVPTSQMAQDIPKDPNTECVAPEQSGLDMADEMPSINGTINSNDHSLQDRPEYTNASLNMDQTPVLPTSFSHPEQMPQLPWTAASQAAGGDVFMGSHGMPYPNSIMFAPPSQDTSFLIGIDQYAQNQQSQNTQADLPPNPFTQASPFNSTYATSQTPVSQAHQPTQDDPIFQIDGHIGSQALLQQFQGPLAPPAPPRRRVIRRALRNLLILSSFPNLELPPTRARSSASLLKDKDRAALIQLSTTLFDWSVPDATAFVNTMLSTAGKIGKKAQAEREAALKPIKPLCAVSNAVARYRDPETGIAYRDARAFGVLRGVVGGGFVWCGDLGCYVGGRAKPLESMGGKGFLGMPPAKGVPRRFLEMQKKVVAPPPPPTEASKETHVVDNDAAASPPTGSVPEIVETVKTEKVAT
ncbi:YL1 nuclear protein-domain-containing protein [Phaeosphaeria sp. MPI-PUGE-AT-0046c]|nr:YL1 nuclear protein-domain-containing protein [Phaeosphaeria sp. MPI-PUGE-AT-0046c]